MFCEFHSHQHHFCCSGACALETFRNGMIVVSVILSTTIYSAWSGDSSGDRSYELGDNRCFRILMYGEVDKIELGKTLFLNWRRILCQNKW